jgi:hypothetical protein
MTGKAIYSLLSSAAGVTAIAGQKIFPSIAKQGTQLPFIVFSLISTDAHDDKDGPSDLDVERWQVSCFAQSYDQADQLNKACRTVLERYSGTTAGVNIQSIRFLGTQDIFEEDAGEKGVHHKSSDYSIRVKL